ncbi:hypothetical protein HYX70_01315 [Candidatus Saccharibacteria bacterium]|nr:hypothetical protein [Candidatus Saccharibacteria bacterium]
MDFWNSWNLAWYGLSALLVLGATLVVASTVRDPFPSKPGDSLRLGVFVLGLLALGGLCAWAGAASFNPDELLTNLVGRVPGEVFGAIAGTVALFLVVAITVTSWPVYWDERARQSKRARAQSKSNQKQEEGNGSKNGEDS